MKIWIYDESSMAKGRWHDTEKDGPVTLFNTAGCAPVAPFPTHVFNTAAAQPVPFTFHKETA